MIDKVAICGTRRANALLPMQEIQQAIGRAGRSYTKSGEAVIFCEPNDFEYAQKCFQEAAPPVKSRLCSIDTIAFHLLPWISRVYDNETFENWFQKSLAHQQGVKILWDDVKKYLVDMQCIDNECNLMDFGRISAKMYFPPNRIKVLSEKLQEAYFNGNYCEPAAMSWILSNQRVPMDDVESIDLANYKQIANSAGYRFHNGELIQGFAYYCILTGQRPKWIKSLVSQLMDDIGRLLNALCMIASVLQYPISEDIQAISTSIFKKVPFQMAKLMEELGIEKKQFAYELFDMDICCKDDFQYKTRYIEKYASDELKKELVRVGILDDTAILKSIGHFEKQDT